MTKKNDDKINIKIILLGESTVGKTNLINVFCDLGFTEKNLPTLSQNKLYKIIRLPNNKDVKITLWDTAGQEKYRCITKNFIQGSNIVIFVYDVTKIETFLEINYWINCAVEELGNENVVFGLVGNKIDLIEESEVDRNEAEKCANNINASFTETSAKKDALGFNSFLGQLLKKWLINNNMMQEGDLANNKPQNIQLNEIKKDKKKSKCC